MDCPDAKKSAIARRARRLVARCPHFRGRFPDVEFECVDDVLVIRGRVATFYQKQVLQTLMKPLEEIRRIDNLVEVISYSYLSSRSH